MPGKITIGGLDERIDDMNKIYISPEQRRKMRKAEIYDILDSDTELLQEVVTELRSKKLEKINGALPKKNNK